MAWMPSRRGYPVATPASRMSASFLRPRCNKPKTIPLKPIADEPLHLCPLPQIHPSTLLFANQIFIQANIMLRYLL